MKHEFSAGGVVYKKDGETVLVLVGQHSKHHGWVFPKGLVGDKVHQEKQEDAAVREVEEETGVVAHIMSSLSPVSYWYVYDTIKIKKTVQYYIMQADKEDFSKRDFELENVEWLKPEDVEKRLTYPSDKKIWKEAHDKLLITNY